MCLQVPTNRAANKQFLPRNIALLHKMKELKVKNKRLATNWHDLNGCTDDKERKSFFACCFLAVVQQMAHSSVSNAIRINLVFGAQTYRCTAYFRNSPNNADTRVLGFLKSWSLNILMQWRKEKHTSLILSETCMQSELCLSLRWQICRGRQSFVTINIYRMVIMLWCARKYKQAGRVGWKETESCFIPMQQELPYMWKQENVDI